MKPLGQLLADSLPPGDPLADLPVAGLSADSRSIAEGFLFAALAGVKADGARFAQDAAARGAVAVVAARDAELGACPLPVVRVDDPRRALALAAAAFYGRQPEIAVAVTGTSGKTSVADFTRQIFTRLGHKAASVGTIGVVRPDGSVYGGLTTPDPVTLHRTLAELADEGIAHLAFEASSHGLDQHRLDGVRLKAAAFTNLGRDHMDYHPTVEHYLGAKLRLFELVERGGPAVINNDDAHADAAIAAARRNGLTVKTVGRKRGSSLFLQSAEREGFQQILRVHFAYGSKILRFPLLGAYQVENALVAASLAALDSERTLAASLDALEYLKGVPGRLEVVGEARGGLAVVDYAHKPEALAAVLASLRPFATGKLICVFGCGGDRDKGKRPIMGDIAVNQADVVIVTDDNPRSEDPATIRAEILAAARGAREIGDRAEAIRTAVRLMGEGDVLVVAGKGHETGQLVAGRTLPFSDREELEKALGEIAA